MSNPATQPRADQIYADALVWDSHAGVYPNPRTDLTGLENWRRAGVSFISINVAYDVMSWEESFPVLAAYRKFLGSNTDKYVIPETVDDIRRAKQEDKLAVAFDLGFTTLNFFG